MTTLNYKILSDPIDKFSDSEKRVFSVENGFRIEYSKEEEIRMGLFASETLIFKDNKDLTEKLSDKYFWSTIPNPFEPFSHDKSYTFIPTCPTNRDPRPIVMKTSDLTINYIEFPGFVSGNQFSNSSNYLLLNGYVSVILYDCDTRKPTRIFIKKDNQNIEFSFFSPDDKNIILILTDRGTDDQFVLVFNLDGMLLEKSILNAPDNILQFNISKYQSLAKSDKYNLFNSSGYAFVAAGFTLNKWRFVSYNRHKNLITLRTYMPVSEIYHNEQWKVKGCDIRIKEVGLTVST
jgi:hypothetical protein